MNNHESRVYLPVIINYYADIPTTYQFCFQKLWNIVECAEGEDEEDIFSNSADSVVISGHNGASVPVNHGPTNCTISRNQN